MKNYVGHCHCGAVKFEALISLQDPFQCNCSFCVRRGGCDAQDRTWVISLDQR